MTLQAFAMATLAANGTLDFNQTINAANTAEWMSDAMQLRADPGIQTIVHGYGLVYADDALHPFLLGDRNLLQTGSDDPMPLSEVRVMSELLGSVMGGVADFPFDKIRVLTAYGGQRFANSGDTIGATSAGKVGPFVRWGTGRRGFVTAGHVAQAAHAPVHNDAGGRIGTVLWSNDPATQPTTHGDIDAALVELDPHVPWSGPSQAVVVPAAGDILQITSNGQSANVLAMCSALQLGAPVATYADCYLLDQIIAAPGDSGGLVTAGGNTVGMVVGGYSGRDMTAVQAAGYQLSEIRSRSGHMVQI